MVIMVMVVLDNRRVAAICPVLWSKLRPRGRGWNGQVGDRRTSGGRVPVPVLGVHRSGTGAGWLHDAVLSQGISWIGRVEILGVFPDR